jgi:Zn-dependent metalloprotease
MQHKKIQDRRQSVAVSCAFFLLTAFVTPVVGAALPGDQAVLRPQTSSAAPDRRSFLSASVDWQVQWDECSGTARSGVASHHVGMGNRIDADRVAQMAESFVLRHAAALGAAGAELVRVRARFSGRSWLITWVQHVDGVPVVGAFIDLTLRQDGKVVAFRSSLRPGLQVAPASLSRDSARQISSHLGIAAAKVQKATPCIVWKPSQGNVGIPAEEVVIQNGEGGRWRLRVSRVDGRVLQQVNLVRTQGLQGTCTGGVRPRTIRDVVETRRLPWLRVQAGPDAMASVAYTDATGSWRLETPPGPQELQAMLRGRYVQVSNLAGAPQAHLERQVTSPGTADLDFNVLNSRLDERTIYYHVNVIHDMFHDRFGFNLLDFAVPAIAYASDPGTGDPNYPNAYWNGEVLGFGNGGGTFYNTGEFSDVIYHEYVHATTDFIYRPIGGLYNFVIGASMHEALSDYFAASLNDDPAIGDGMFRDRTPWLRNLQSHRIWPDDMDLGARANVHSNGLILSGALWNLRQSVGAPVADALAHHARELLPLDFQQYFDAVLLQDDLLFGDAFPGNGSPHHDAILLAFGEHGIGPLREGSLWLEHEPLVDTMDDTQSRLVRARMHSMYEGTDRAMRLLWSTGDSFEGIWMQETPSGAFEAHIPAQPVGTRVRYYLAAVVLPPVVTTTLPASAPQATYSYRVGPDTTAPTITHVPPGSHAAFAGAPHFTVTATDNSGISHAWIEYRIDAGPRSTTGLVPDVSQHDVFTGQLPHALSVGSAVQYRIHAIDGAPAPHRSVQPTQGWYELQIVDALALDFESGPAGWTHEALLLDRADEWSLSAAHNHSLLGSWAWHCQTAEAADHAVAAVLMTPRFDLEEAASASIWSWIQASAHGAQAVDAAQVQIQVGDADWQVLTPEGGYSHQVAADLASNYLPPGSACLSGTSADWRLLSFDLTPHAGRSVRLRFLFSSASPVLIDTSEWFLDDFHLQAGSPIASDTSPPSAHAARLLLGEPSPNPFNPTVEFVLESPVDRAAVRLDILDVQGRRVRTLLRGPLSHGQTRVRWDGRDRRGLASASGVYYYLLESGLGRETGAIVLVR